MNKQPHSFYTIRFGDCDMFGHLNNARYIDYFINAREDHLKQAYEVGLMTYFKQGIGWFIGNHQISYLRPAAYNERVRISSQIIQASDESLLVEMLMTDEKETYSKALLWTTFIPINVRTGKREKHTEDFMSFAKSVEIIGINYKSGFEERVASL